MVVYAQVAKIGDPICDKCKVWLTTYNLVLHIISFSYYLF